MRVDNKRYSFRILTDQIISLPGKLTLTKNEEKVLQNRFVGQYQQDAIEIRNLINKGYSYVQYCNFIVFQIGDVILTYNGWRKERMDRLLYGDDENESKEDSDEEAED